MRFEADCQNKSRLIHLTFGLLLVVAGQVMRQAVVLVEENRSFV